MSEASINKVSLGSHDKGYIDRDGEQHDRRQDRRDGDPGRTGRGSSRCVRGFLIACSVLLVALTLLISGCRGQQQRRIGLFLYDAQDTFILELSEQIRATIEGDFVLDRFDAEKDQIRQNEQIIAYLEENPAMVVVNSVDRLACGALASKLDSRGVPVIFINREPLSSEIEDYPNVYYVGAAPAAQGMMQAEIVHSLIGDDFASSRYDRNADGIIQLLILKGEQGHQDAERRTTSSIEALKSYGYKVEVLDIAVASWSRLKAKKVMESVYRRYPDQIELILSNNDDMALGALDYLKAKNRRFLILGVDGTKAGIAAVRDGQLDGTVLNDAATQSRAIRELIDYILEEKSMEDFPYPMAGGRFLYVEGMPIRNLSE